MKQGLKQTKECVIKVKIKKSYVNKKTIFEFDKCLKTGVNLRKRGIENQNKNRNKNRNRRNLTKKAFD